MQTLLVLLHSALSRTAVSQNRFFFALCLSILSRGAVSFNRYSICSLMVYITEERQREVAAVGLNRAKGFTVNMLLSDLH